GDDVKAAMLLLIGHWYENRETVSVGQAATDIPFTVEALLQPYKIYGI
ncbi:TPA: phage gp6-like head-tail connector protein, partial [Klebsiella pneumoniae]|nr:phage gp6-like head-tail connector protein [Klebsiella pneumoniae]